MRKHLKDFFIPHHHNNYHPHILHTKRAIFYSAVFIFLKIIVFGFALLIPLEVFVSPDVLAAEQQKLISLTNEVRAAAGLPLLDTNDRLFLSSHLRASDMAEHEYFSHHGPDGHNLAYFLSAAGYAYEAAGENLAVGFDRAEDIVNAWIASPTHYDNLVDAEFEELGISLYGGMYEGYPVIFVSEHFGFPERREESLQRVSLADFGSEDFFESEKETVSSSSSMAAAFSPSISELDAAPQVSGEHVDTSKELAPLVRVNQERSSVDWEAGDAATMIIARVHIAGDVQSASVLVAGHTLSLAPAEEEGVYVGKQSIPVLVEDIFRVATLPTVRIVGTQGEFVEEVIRWEKVKIVQPSAVDRYIRSRDFLGGMMSIFSVSKAIFLIGILFFLGVLSLNIFVQIRKQHPHVIAQTFGVIALLCSLWII